MIKKLSRLASLTETEIKIFIFVLTMLCIGLAIKYFTSEAEQKIKKFSYSKEDSLFAYFNNLEFDTATTQLEAIFPNTKLFSPKILEQSKYEKKEFRGRLNLNSATSAQLATLPGIGAKTAEQICNYKKRVGNIKSLDELLNVKGIGEKKLTKLKHYLTLN